MFASTTTMTAVSVLAVRPRSPLLPLPTTTTATDRPPGAAAAVRLSGARNLGITTPRADKEVRCARWRHALSKPNTPEDSLIQKGLPVPHLPGHDLRFDDDDDDDGTEEVLELYGSRGIWQMVDDVKAMLRRMGDGEISISAYDTAWVALVKKINGSGGPQFPSSLQWIIHNQLQDGSWGDGAIFSAHDRMINTLACVIALTSWSIYPDKCNRGLSFISENMWRLGEEEEDLMPIGFEVAFPSLVDVAKALELEIPYGDPALQGIYAKRNLKLERIPKDVMHEVPTSLLYSLEGMPDLDWERLLRLQFPDGSFLFSPSSTAYALMRTGDENCLKYLQRVIHRFDGGVPNVYPVDLFEHLWAVDRLERLGISRYFEQEIKDCLDYVYRYWTEDGICWAKNSRVNDVDDTSMGFRLLRLHGYDVSAGVLRQFEKDGEFFCLAGQSNQAVTGMYNLNRASQVLFPGEEILERAKSFSYRFLREKQAAEQLVDKWIITKDLPGEVEYALEFPWYASLPRVETRLYLEQYGGGSDVWIGKTLYRMPLVNNDVYLELAKLDFVQCQALHQLEWFDLQKWYEEVGLRLHGVKRRSLLKAYFLATACISEPDRAAERLGWARTAVLAEAVSTYFRSHPCTDATRQAFILDFLGDDGPGISRPERQMSGKGLAGLLRQMVDCLAFGARPAHRQERPYRIRHHLRQAWKEWLLTWRKDDMDGLGREEIGLLVVKIIEICAGRFSSTELIVTHPDYNRLAHLLSSLCHRLRRRQLLATEDTRQKENKEDKVIEAEMQELAECVVGTSDNLNRYTKQTFLLVAKSFYYAAHCSSADLNTHISQSYIHKVSTTPGWKHFDHKEDDGIRKWQT